ncbi:MAG: hypothetical protein Q9220_004544 [cf. Caloplaca sp. 1 TL-2023]
MHRGTSRQSPNTTRPSPDQSGRDILRDASTQEQSVYRKYMENAFAKLGEERRKERENAIRDGLLADPDKPTTLANAITVVGTCQDMCAEYERAQRVVQFMVDDCETVAHATKEDIKVPSEERMVKRYRRPAAGYEEQLPSDIRSPLVLQKTLDYLLNEIVGGSEPLANVHKFVWDRTRAVRNDFSIQQVTKVEELRIAISCFERIARFHILSLHQLAGTGDNSIDFDAYQEREQLNNTLLSLMYYYDDSRHKLISPNEAEFRAYCVIFAIEDQRPDLEDRAQNWQPEILKDHRVRTALKVYAAAANASDPQGPLRPQKPNTIAQASPTLFFDLVQSPAVPYLMACVSEIYFNKIRRTALDTIWRAYKVKRGGSARTEDWTVDEVTNALGFDDEDQAQNFCEEHGFVVSEREDGESYIDLGSVAGRYLSDSNTSRKQPYSIHLVEQKRHGRTLPAIVNGLNAAQAQAQGLIVKDDVDSDESSSTAKDETLFLPEDSTSTKPDRSLAVEQPFSIASQAQIHSSEQPAKPSLFSRISASPFQPQTSIDSTSSTPSSFFGKPSTSAITQSDSQPFVPSIKFPTSVNLSPFSFQQKNPDTAAIPSTPEIHNNSRPSSQIESNESTASPRPKSIHDLSSTSSINPPKFSFATSPLFSQNGASNTTQVQEKDAKVQFGTGPSQEVPSFLTSQHEVAHSPSPFSTLRPSTSISPSSTPFPSASAPIFENRSAQISPQLSFPPLNPPSIPSLASPTTTSRPRIEDNTARNTTAELKTTVPKPIPPVSPSRDDSRSLETKSSHLKRNANSSQLNSPELTDKNKPIPPFINITPSNTAVPAFAEHPVDPRPSVLDALSEGLLMDDQGLLQQFIEYTVGPIVHQAFRDVEEDRSWKRAREVRSVLLSKKYLRLWKDNAWKRKLLRKGKKRRAIFAESMNQMAKSSRQRQSPNDVPLQSSLTDKTSSPNIAQRDMPPPPLPSSSLKRKSLPNELQDDKIPDTDTWQKNKRRRQEPLEDPNGNTPSLHKSLRPQHKRSRTMGHSRGPWSLPGSLADFDTLGESVHERERAMQHARRLVGRTKLDTTRGDYFALKSRGIDPDTPLIPQPANRHSRVDEQIARVRKFLTSTPATKQSTPPLSQARSQTGIATSQVNDAKPSSIVPTRTGDDGSPNRLLAQIREVRQALADDTAWFQSEREKSERLSSSRTSEDPPEISRRPAIDPHASDRPRIGNPMPTRAQIHLEQTKANGLLPPDWDWNKSVTEWKLRGGVGSPRASASRDASGSSTPVHPAQKAVVGLSAMTNGLGKRVEKVNKAAEVVFDDEDDVVENGAYGEGDDGDDVEDEDGDEGESEDEDDIDPNTFEEGYGDNGYNGFYDGEEEEKEEDEEEEDISPEQAVLQGKGASVDTAIDLD